ncbi:MAG: enoyl-CoA hydratase-related protein [Candidatus Binatia bacterium]|nr:enoyl-CoA hydratase-related protein [Candidatus Binatia bacterium]
MASHEFIEVDEAAPGVCRITLSRPEKRNAINNAMRGELLAALQAADRDDAVRVSILRGAGTCFSSGYDIKSDLGADQPYFTADVGMQWARHVAEGWMSLWDLAKPVIAQVHGYALAGGLELVGACDLAYAARDARFAHPVLRVAGVPDFAWFPVAMAPRHAMELHVAGREYDGDEAERVGMINQAFPPEELEARVLQIAQRITEVPPAVVTVNKRLVHSAVEARGGRSVIRTAADLQAGPHMQALGQMSGAALSDQVKKA